MVSMVAQKQICWLGFFCVEFACFTFVCCGFLHTVLKKKWRLSKLKCKSPRDVCLLCEGAWPNSCGNMNILHEVAC